MLIKGWLETSLDELLGLTYTEGRDSFVILVESTYVPFEFNYSSFCWCKGTTFFLLNHLDSVLSVPHGNLLLYSIHPCIGAHIS